MTKTPSIVFDFGGVLIDWDPRYLYRKLFPGDEPGMEQFLKEIDFYTWNLEQDRGYPFGQAVQEHADRFPHYAALIRAYGERWEESMSGPIQGTVEILKELKEAGYPLYGLSNWSAEKFRIVRPVYPFWDWFKLIVLSGDLGIIKPDPRIFTSFLERAGLPAEACVYIDDSPANVQVSRSLGFRAVRFTTSETLRRDLQALGILL